MKPKVISITGTPGTGKTRLAGMLSKKICARVLNLRELVEEDKIPWGFDSIRDTKVVDVSELRKHVEERISGSTGDVILDGILSRFMPATHIIVLRADPRILGKRLRTRGYSESKIRENLEAELLGVCLYDSLWCGNVLELDASKKIDLKGILAWIKEGGRRIMEINWFPQFYEVLRGLNP